MNSITFRNVIPEVFRDCKDLKSEIWLFLNAVRCTS